MVPELSVSISKTHHKAVDELNVVTPSENENAVITPGPTLGPQVEWKYWLILTVKAQLAGSGLLVVIVPDMKFDVV
jgi:hypothetical protein